MTRYYVLKMRVIPPSFKTPAMGKCWKLKTLHIVYVLEDGAKVLKPLTLDDGVLTEVVAGLNIKLLRGFIDVNEAKDYAMRLNYRECSKIPSWFGEKLIKIKHKLKNIARK